MSYWNVQGLKKELEENCHYCEGAGYDGKTTAGDPMFGPPACPECGGSGLQEDADRRNDDLLWSLR